MALILKKGYNCIKTSLFNANYRVNLGITYTLGSNLFSPGHTDLSAQHTSRYQSIVSSGATIDSLTYSSIGGRMKIPQDVTFGVSFGKIDRWTVGWDFTYHNFTSFDYRTNDQHVQYIGTPTTGFKSGIGFEFVPAPEDFTNYLNRVTYRLGGSYERSPMLVNNRPLMDIGFTLGASLPVSRFSTIDLALKFGKRGTVSQNVLQEDYVRIFFGITFLDQWFIRRKFD
ncbi:MAG: hypothetical protein QM734_02445 [Cyclobacteriaceae bacterium]